ncbi:BspA family leucine-rich repeat surface protein, partial [Mycoplasma sp. HU2014]|uniref:BspA family leucine-rich repeat surface protein n=1 Tax=Mycoplasma sp. HU2014 TaxID=1664275 RepID=UPI00067B7201
MRLVKSLIVKIGASVLVTSGTIASVGTGIYYLNKTNQERKNLIILIKNTNIGFINKSELNENKLIELIKKINPNLNLDFSKLEFHIQSDKIVVKPKPNDNTYKNQVKILFTLSQDLSVIINNKDLGTINSSDKTNQNLLKLIKEKNPGLDTDKVELVVQENKVIVKPKTGDKTYEGEVEFTFKVLTKEEQINIQININKIKAIWNDEFKDRFYDGKNFYYEDNLSLNNEKLLKAINRRLKVNGLNISVSKGDENINLQEWNKKIITKGQASFEIRYRNELIKLDLGEFNKFNTKFKDDKKEEVVELGYIISPEDGLFTAFVDNIENRENAKNIKKVPDKLNPKIESLAFLFYSNINEKIEGIEKWDTSNITNMFRMFEGAENFNQDISGWNTSKVRNMSAMFLNTFDFNQNINTKIIVKEDRTSYKAWDVSSVTDMSGMFDGAEAFNQNIGNWDVSNVINMNGMFGGAKAFNQDISTRQI